MTTYIRTAAGNMRMHLERHVYKRGQFKGDAPLDGGRRGRNHTRVIKVRDGMAVQMYHTEILVAHDDGRVTIGLGGWDDSSTTKARLNESFKFVPFRVSMGSRTVFSQSQPCIRVEDKTYRYYDGIEFDGEGNLLTEAKPFDMWRIDKEAAKEFATEVKASGFLDMFPLLYATAQPNDPTQSYSHEHLMMIRQMKAYVSDADQAHRWSEIIARFKFDRVYDYKYGTYLMVESGTASTCWSVIMTLCKKDMYGTVPSNVTVI